MTSGTFRWWHEDEAELKLWKHLNSLSPEDRQANHKELCDELVKRYGNIYFYVPFDHQLPVHECGSVIRNIHGNNSGGKSYCAAAETAYEIVGWSPYRDIPLTPFGSKVIWVVTTSFKIQLNSSQLLLFADVNAPVRDVGLLPPLEDLEAMGAKVVWEGSRKTGILNHIVMPNGTRIEFKSMEQRAFSLAGAAVDFVWLDEVAPDRVYDECGTRILRKNGKMIMSFLLGGDRAIADNYILTDIYPTYVADKEAGKDMFTEFFFFAIEDNKSLDPEQVKARKQAVTGTGKSWRFSVGGMFNVEPAGVRVYDPYRAELHERDGLAETCDSMRILYRVWDLGYARPCCTAFQLDEYNRVKIMFSMIGDKEQLIDFISKVKAKTAEVCPQAVGFHEIIPHDAKRHDGTGVSNQTAEMVFDDNNMDTTWVYVHAEDAIMAFNQLLSKLIKAEPAVQVDSLHALNTANCMTMYSRNDKGEPEDDKFYIHFSDNLKLLAQWMMKMGLIQVSSFRGSSTSQAPGYMRNNTPRYKEGY